MRPARLSLFFYIIYTLFTLNTAQKERAPLNADAECTRELPLLSAAPYVPSDHRLDHQHGTYSMLNRVSSSCPLFMVLYTKRFYKAHFRNSRSPSGRQNNKNAFLARIINICVREPRRAEMNRYPRNGTPMLVCLHEVRCIF